MTHELAILERRSCPCWQSSLAAYESSAWIPCCTYTTGPPPLIGDRWNEPGPTVGTVATMVQQSYNGGTNRLVGPPSGERWTTSGLTFSPLRPPNR
ncbi:hypothetical protein PCASD_07604 [Puccinia coronata f. sp. avenae]|uniref:Uncharacterized protein n=1 Tax=Puccinia coronata f. sp. avenae TaxID=200324 RepID=A0A2N5UNB9_9BASI|nr:hypothetical protein PCASD_07604 [Puccinia coronata f. sp. avenae]